MAKKKKQSYTFAIWVSAIMLGILIAIIVTGVFRSTEDPVQVIHINLTDSDDIILEEIASDGVLIEAEQVDEVEETPLDEQDVSQLDETQVSEGLIFVMVTEGDLVHFPNLEAVDPDGDDVHFYFSAPLNENGEWQTQTGDAGTYTVNITASDGRANTTKTVMIIVEAVQLPPSVQLPEKITVQEGERVTLQPVISHPQNKPVEIEYSGWMTTNTRTTTHGDAGEYMVIVTVSDDVHSVVNEVTVVVEHVNRPPVFISII
ncbi:MAG: hypothetical protein ACMXYE_05505 [Candidatus Woesearchaeota archaeon]